MRVELVPPQSGVRSATHLPRWDERVLLTEAAFTGFRVSIGICRLVAARLI